MSRKRRGSSVSLSSSTSSSRGWSSSSTYSVSSRTVYVAGDTRNILGFDGISLSQNRQKSFSRDVGSSTSPCCCRVSVVPPNRLAVSDFESPSRVTVHSIDSSTTEADDSPVVLENSDSSGRCLSGRVLGLATIYREDSDALPLIACGSSGGDQVLLCNSSDGSVVAEFQKAPASVHRIHYNSGFPENLFVSGASSVCMFDLERHQTPLCVFNHAVKCFGAGTDGAPNCVLGVGTSGFENRVYSCGLDRLLKVWDWRDRKKWVKDVQLPSESKCLLVCENKHRVFVGLTQGRVGVFDSRRLSAPLEDPPFRIHDYAIVEDITRIDSSHCASVDSHSVARWRMNNGDPLVRRTSSWNYGVVVECRGYPMHFPVEPMTVYAHPKDPLGRRRRKMSRFRSSFCKFLLPLFRPVRRIGVSVKTKHIALDEQNRWCSYESSSYYRDLFNFRRSVEIGGWESTLSTSRPSYLIDKDLVKVIRSEILGKGSFGMVKLGTLKVGATQEIPVAVKTGLITRSDIATVTREVRFMTEANHKNILRCYGSWFEKDQFWIVLEFCNEGDFRVWSGKMERKNRMTDALRLSSLLQIAEAMEYLHSSGSSKPQPIIHRDLKPENILVHRDDHGDFVMKLADFGLSDHQGTATESRIKGSIGYVPPKPTQCQDLKKIDVYAYGIICWEVWTGEKAYARAFRPGLPDIEKFYAIHGPSPIRPDLSCCETMPDGLQILMTRCWNADEHVRPLFPEIVATLKAIQSGTELDLLSRIRTGDSSPHEEGWCEGSGVDGLIRRLESHLKEVRDEEGEEMLSDLESELRFQYQRWNLRIRELLGEKGGQVEEEEENEGEGR